MLKMIGAWCASGIVGYIFAALSSQIVVLVELMRLGLEIPLQDNIQSVLHAILNMRPFLIVFLIGFAIAFSAAWGVKKLLPALAIIAYPIAGAASIATALGLMHARFGVFPILGAQETYGLVLQIIAGAVGGAAFEILRPKQPLSA